MELEVEIFKVSKCNYRIKGVQDGIYLGKAINGVACYLEFRNEFTAAAYIDRDKRLILVK